MLDSLLAVATPMLPTNTVAENRWESLAPYLAVLTLLILVGDVGPQGWLSQWPTEAAHDRLLDCEANPLATDYMKQETKRLYGFSRACNDRGWTISVTIACPGTRPMDRLLRYLQEADQAEKKTCRRTPLILALVGECSPIIVAMCEIAALLDEDRPRS